MENRLTNNFQVCATCGRWCGQRKPEFGGIVSFDTDEKGLCSGGDYNGLEMTCMSSCSKWEIWAALR